MRPTIDETMLEVVLALSRRGTCLKMLAGCVLTDRRGRIISTGYNGVAAGRPHCNHSLSEDGFTYSPLDVNEHPHKCAGADAPPGSDLCEAVHAEQNALTWCRAPDSIHACYLNVSPCMRCAKQLLNTGCKRIVFLEEYTREPQARALWTSAGREWLLCVPNSFLLMTLARGARQLGDREAYPTKLVG